MEKTFEVIERYTLSYFHDYNDSSQPAKFTSGIHRDMNCARLAQKLKNRIGGNNKPLDWKIYMVFLDDQEKCIGVKSINALSESGFQGINSKEMLALCITSKAAKVIFLMAGRWYDWVANSNTAKNLNKRLKMVECEFVELRYVHPNGEVTIQDGK